MSKNILFSNTSWRSHLLREATERRTADEQKEDKCNKVTSFQETPDDEHYASEKLLFDSLQAILEKITLEISRAYESENFIYNELQKEKSFAADCDAALQSAIEGEEKRATNEESAIKKSIELLQKFADYKNILQLNTLIKYGCSATGMGESVNASEIISGCYNLDAQFIDDALALTSIYELSIGKAYKINCNRLSDASLANVVLFDIDGNVYPFNIDLSEAIIIPDRAVSSIGLSYVDALPVVQSFNPEQIVATVAEGTVSRHKLSREFLEEINEIVRSVTNEAERAISAEENIINELRSKSSSDTETFESMQSQIENEIIRSTLVDKNLLKRVDTLEGRFVVLSEDEYNSIEYKDDDKFYFITES